MKIEFRPSAVWGKFLPFLLAGCAFLNCRSQAQTTDPGSGPPRPLTLDVVYTGRTLGYFRFPNFQPRLSFDHCVDDPNTMSDSTRDFYRNLSKEAASAQLLLGMGDNFAIDLNARTFADGPEGSRNRQPKDLWTWDDANHQWIPDNKVVKGSPLERLLVAGNGTIPADNVGCFIRYAKYDAIVPGKHDFYYGPERLRMLARFLMTDQGAAFPKVRMLAANMAIVSSAPLAAPRIPDFQRQRDITGHNALGYQVIQQPKDGEPGIQVALPDAVLPYLRQITIHNAFDLFAPTGARIILQNEPDKTTFVSRPQGLPGGANAVTLTEPGGRQVQANVVYRFDTVQFCPAKAGAGDPYQLDFTKCVDLIVDAPALAGAKSLKNDLFYRTKSPVLEPNSDWGVCLHLLAPQRKDVPPVLCQLFTVHAPFLQYPNGADSPIPPYFLKTVGNGAVAIFGVVDPALSSSVGRLNDAWLNTNRKYDTQVEVIDPASALSQVLQECNADVRCMTARKVLLAQMSNSAALQLVSNLDFTFDLVVSATDDTRETGNIVFTKDITTPPLRSTDGRPPSVVTPGSVYNANNPGQITLLFQHATVTRPPGCQDNSLCAGEWQLRNRVTASPCACVPPAGGGTTLRTAALKALEGRGVKDTSLWSTEDALERLALLLMQERFGADVSMLQGRDLFEAKETGDANVTPGNLKDLIDRVYWKGDFALPITVTGATLKSLLKKSAAFTAAENNSVNIDLEKGQGLISLAVFKELATAAYLVNAQPIRDASLYSVAATDYLAFGDTGYTDFQTPPVPPPLRVRDFRTLHPIANLVCASIRDALAANVNPTYRNTDCGPLELIATSYQDASDQLPFDTTAGYTAWRRFVAWAAPTLHYHRDFDVYAGANDAEKRSQEKPRFSITMEKADVSLTDNLHQQTLHPVAGGIVDAQTLKFNGNPISQVTAPNSLSLSYDNRTRIRWAGRRFDWFALDDLAYSSTTTQNTPTNPNYTRSLSSNSLGIEAGFLARILPVHRKEVWDIKVLVSERLDTQLRSPLISLPLNDVQTSTYLRALNHTYRLLTKNGFRLDDERSWVEAGIEYGEDYRLPKSYQFGNQMCPGGAGENPANAVYLSPKPVTPSVPAYPAGDQSLLDCVAYYSDAALFTSPTITDASPLSVMKTNRAQRGIFLNFSFNIPLPVTTKVSYLLENKGDLFANLRNDLPTDTRYFDELSNSLLIAAFGNFSVKPEVDFYTYKARVTGYEIHTWQTMVSLSYSFDWRRGLSPRALLYANPAPKTSTPAGGK
jgi:hypothetical protein